MPPVAPASIPLWLCADLGALEGTALVRKLERVAAKLAVCVWLRPVSATLGGALAELAREIGPIVHATSGGLVVGERLDVAVAVQADGVHLGAASVSPSDAVRYLAEVSPEHRPRVSVAVHSAFEVIAAAPYADALVLSPFRDVPGKGARLDIAGFAVITAQAPALPFVALGGIQTPQDARDAARAGATALAVRRVLVDLADPLDRCMALRDAFVSALDGRIQG